MIFKVSNYYLEKKKINYFGCEIWMFTYIFYKELFVLRRLIESWSPSPLNATNNSKLSFVKHLFNYFFIRIMSAGQFIVNCKFQAHMQQTNVHLSLSFFFFNLKNTLYHTYLFVYWKNYICNCISCGIIEIFGLFQFLWIVNFWMVHKGVWFL